jgi:hypothetical protein
MRGRDVNTRLGTFLESVRMRSNSEIAPGGTSLTSMEVRLALAHGLEPKTVAIDNSPYHNQSVDRGISSRTADSWVGQSEAGSTLR